MKADAVDHLLVLPGRAVPGDRSATPVPDGITGAGRVATLLEDGGAIEMAASEFDHVVEQTHQALDEFFTGNPEPAKQLYSHRDDVSLANPFGPVARGWKQVAETMERAASNYRDGEATGFERIVTNVTAELAYLVEVERYRAKVGGSEEIVPVALRVTTIFRPEDGTWKMVHRHADPITAPRPPDSVLQQ
jgi:ketosteroid isomerase-like protein